MDQASLNKRTEHLFAEIRNLLDRKAADYAPGYDRLGNFYRREAVSGMTAQHVCFSDLMKHIDALGVMLGDQSGRIDPPTQTFRERVLDAMTYLVLLDCLKRPWSDDLKVQEFVVGAPPPATLANQAAVNPTPKRRRK